MTMVPKAKGVYKLDKENQVWVKIDFVFETKEYVTTHTDPSTLLPVWPYNPLLAQFNPDRTHIDEYGSKGTHDSNDFYLYNTYSI